MAASLGRRSGLAGAGMRGNYREWLTEHGYAPNTVNTQVSQANVIERAYGDLDAAYDADRFGAILAGLQYSKADQRNGAPDPSRLGIGGDLYTNLASYRATLSYYRRFREAEDGAPDLTAALEALRAKFLERCPDFTSFAQTHGAYWRLERGYKDEVIARAAALMADHGGADDETLGRAMLQLLQTPPANFIGWRTFAQIKAAGAEAERGIAQAIGALLKSPADPASAAAEAAARIQPLLSGMGNVSYGQTRQLVTTPLALTRPAEAIDVKTRYMQRAAKQLTGQTLFKSQPTAEEYGFLLSLARRVFETMRDEWGWAPRDLWDVQGFLWIAVDENWAVDAAPTDEEVEEEDKGLPPSKHPLNLVLHGPPGTGKTWTTARIAVEICDGAAPDGRAAVMARYDQLRKAGRIGFVTFHQSMSYEDFVEGLRPMTDGGAGAGFRLEARPGVFKEIAAQAEQARTGSPAGAPLELGGRAVWKMSLGRAADQGDVFRAAIEGGYVALDWINIDWSPSAYGEAEEILKRCRNEEPGVTAASGMVRHTHAFRNLLQPGDLVVVSDGNFQFRAIGVLTGAYGYEPGAPNFRHRRATRWLRVFQPSLPASLIYEADFSQQSIYQLDPGKLKRAALAELIGGDKPASAEPERYVLVIDEINRANISKVLGELITLLEPDKRLGAPNQLKVTLPYSRESFGVPANLHLVGTMNTADRSIALLDTALRRRFRFEEMMPDPSRLGAEVEGVSLAALLDGINRRIEYLFDRDHQIGHAFFIGVDSLAALDAVMRGQVIPLLVEYFHEDWEKVRIALNDREGGFVSALELSPPAMLNGDGEARRRYAINRAPFPLSAYLAASE